MAQDPRLQKARPGESPTVPKAGRKAARGPAERGGPAVERDDDLERERLQPGLNAEGTGGAGAPPDLHKERGDGDT